MPHIGHILGPVCNATFVVVLAYVISFSCMIVRETGNQIHLGRENEGDERITIYIMRLAQDGQRC